MARQNSINALKGSFSLTTLLFVLTAFHHYYGSIAYGTPWRAHVVLVGGIALLLCFLLYRLFLRDQNRWLLYSYLLTAFIVFGLLIGLTEGFYNHTVKDLLYFSGMRVSSWRILFPAPVYELPDNVIFESTGILQFPLGIIQIYTLYNTYRRYKNVML